MAFILIVTLIIYVILCIWIWHNLGKIENSKKISYIIISLAINLVITFFIFNISKNNIVYENQNMEADVRNILVLVFTACNSLIIAPFIAKQLDKVNEGTISDKELKRNFIIIIIIYIICLVLESGYLKDIQQGIINMYNARK